MKKSSIEKFEKLEIQIKELNNQMSLLSKKTPNSAVNVFKLKYINIILETANEFLDDVNKPFKDFSIFSEDDLPFYSDVVLILSQYIECLEKLKFNNITRLSSSWYWVIDNKKSEIKTICPPQYRLLY